MLRTACFWHLSVAGQDDLFIFTIMAESTAASMGNRCCETGVGLSAT